MAQYVLAQLQELQAASSTQKQTEIISALGGTLLNPTWNHRRLVEARHAALCPSPCMETCMPVAVTSRTWPGSATEAWMTTWSAAGSEKLTLLQLVTCRRYWQQACLGGALCIPKAGRPGQCCTDSNHAHLAEPPRSLCEGHAAWRDKSDGGRASGGCSGRLHPSGAAAALLC